uniref:Uncharacterized protein n=1 Tax=Panagrolaimus davidi TaxID=227884 RepID=A0A914PK47_9BILA
METEEIWPTLNEEIIEKYSTFFNNGIQIAIFSLFGILFATVFLIYIFIWIFDKSTKISLPTQYSIRFDPKGFSSNELRLYNVKSVDGGCGLKSIKPTERGKAGIIQAERMFESSMFPRIDILQQPWIGRETLAAQTTFQILDWNNYFDYPAETSDLKSVAAKPGPSAALTPSNSSRKLKKVKVPPPPSPSPATPTASPAGGTTPQTPSIKTPQIAAAVATPVAPTQTSAENIEFPPANIKKNSRTSPDSFKSIK